MITLTKKEALNILKAISKLEGVLIANKQSADALELLSMPSEILSYKILQDEKQDDTRNTA